MNEIDVLKKENEDLRRECEILQKILLDERRFFVQEFKNANLDSDCYNCSHYTDNLVYLDIFFGSD
ncbi:hypothetical protein ACTQ4G_02730 [Streptococcus alactolyticus]|uniref:hypothetical protein n=1 Tax=Streptococcus alactolyticus TaxID=29389 RepID=UPI003F96C625